MLRYRQSIPRPVSAQFMHDDTIAMFELTFDGNDVHIVHERHYRLTKADNIDSADLAVYRRPNPT